eukprot:scaffold973_cov399-Prasinococcus_capsulatus_cf.AAC.31
MDADLPKGFCNVDVGLGQEVVGAPVVGIVVEVLDGVVEPIGHEQVCHVVLSHVHNAHVEACLQHVADPVTWLRTPTHR